MECPKECDYVQYDTTVSYATYPSDDYLNLLQEHLPFKNRIMEGDEKYKKEIQKDSVLSLNVFYPSESLTRIQEEPKTTIVNNVMPNIGGHLG